ncbi:unnamed protein product [Caenorhabditis sp. 36 PRJEB53466]|nr:unnamed protein product [Caenorhabditis sp. 36 PRJEB53466]
MAKRRFGMHGKAAFNSGKKTRMNELRRAIKRRASEDNNDKENDGPSPNKQVAINLVPEAVREETVSACEVLVVDNNRNIEKSVTQEREGAKIKGHVFGTNPTDCGSATWAEQIVLTKKADTTLHVMCDIKEHLNTITKTLRDHNDLLRVHREEDKAKREIWRHIVKEEVREWIRKIEKRTMEKIDAAQSTADHHKEDNNNADNKTEKTIEKPEPPKKSDGKGKRHRSCLFCGDENHGTELCNKYATPTTQGRMPLHTDSLQKIEDNFTVRQLHEYQIRGCILRPINIKQTKILDAIPVATLFDEQLASVPIFIKCADNSTRIIVCEGNHRVSSVLRRDPSDESFKVETVTISEADFDATFEKAVDLRGESDGLNQKCGLDAIPWIVASFVQQVFTSERLRTENSYSAKDRAMNLYEILKARVSEEQLDLLRENTRIRNKLYEQLVKEKLALKSTQSQTERSGLYLFLSAPNTRTLFLKHFSYLPTKEKCHSNIFAASLRNDCKTVKLIHDCAKEYISKMMFLQKVKDLKTGLEDEDKDVGETMWRKAPS